jgi:hypothetical protein
MRGIFALFFVLLVTAILPSTSLAQEEAGIGMSPMQISHPVTRGQVLTDTVTVKNLSVVEETYYLFVRDIVDVTDGGRPIYADPNQDPSTFEVSTWITLAQNEVTVAPNSEVTVPLVITVPEDAPPCSNFGAIFASVEPPEQVNTGAAVGYQIANIVTLRVPGECVDDVFLRSFGSERYVHGTKNVTFITTLENRGTTDVAPRGPVDIYNMLGEKVASVLMNEPSNRLFPGQDNREFRVTWEDDSFGFGRYTAEMALSYGSEDTGGIKSVSSATTFWILPWEIIRPLLITLFVLFVVSYFLIRRIIQGQVRRLAGGRRYVRQAGAQNAPSVLMLATIAMLIVTAFALFVLLLLFA